MSPPLSSGGGGSGAAAPVGLGSSRRSASSVDPSPPRSEAGDVPVAAPTTAQDDDSSTAAVTQSESQPAATTTATAGKNEPPATTSPPSQPLPTTILNEDASSQASPVAADSAESAVTTVNDENEDQDGPDGGAADTGLPNGSVASETSDRALSPPPSPKPTHTTNALPKSFLAASDPDAAVALLGSSRQAGAFSRSASVLAESGSKAPSLTSFDDEDDDGEGSTASSYQIEPVREVPSLVVGGTSPSAYAHDSSAADETLRVPPPSALPAALAQEQQQAAAASAASFASTSSSINGDVDTTRSASPVGSLVVEPSYSLAPSEASFSTSSLIGDDDPTRSSSPVGSLVVEPSQSVASSIAGTASSYGDDRTPDNNVNNDDEPEQPSTPTADHPTLPDVGTPPAAAVALSAIATMGSLEIENAEHVPVLEAKEREAFNETVGGGGAAKPEVEMEAPVAELRVESWAEGVQREQGSEIDETEAEEMDGARTPPAAAAPVGIEAERKEMVENADEEAHKVANAVGGEEDIPPPQTLSKKEDEEKAAEEVADAIGGEEEIPPPTMTAATTKEKEEDMERGAVAPPTEELAGLAISSESHDSVIDVVPTGTALSTGIEPPPSSAKEGSGTIVTPPIEQLTSLEISPEESAPRAVSAGTALSKDVEPSSTSTADIAVPLAAAPTIDTTTLDAGAASDPDELSSPIPGSFPDTPTHSSYARSSSTSPVRSRSRSRPSSPQQHQATDLEGERATSPSPSLRILSAFPSVPPPPLERRSSSTADIASAALPTVSVSSALEVDPPGMLGESSRRSSTRSVRRPTKSPLEIDSEDEAEERAAMAAARRAHGGRADDEDEGPRGSLVSVSRERYS